MRIGRERFCTVAGAGEWVCLGLHAIGMYGRRGRGDVPACTCVETRYDAVRGRGHTETGRGDLGPVEGGLDPARGGAGVVDLRDTTRVSWVMPFARRVRGGMATWLAQREELIGNNRCQRSSKAKKRESHLARSSGDPLQSEPTEMKKSPRQA